MNWQTSEADAYDAWQFDLLVALICVLYVYIVALSQQTELACGACQFVVVFYCETTVVALSQKTKLAFFMFACLFLSQANL